MQKFKPQFRRLLFIDRKIREGRYPNCTSLAKEWEVSVKTIQRDINYFKWELDAPANRDTGLLLALLKFKPEDYQYILDNSPPLEPRVNHTTHAGLYDNWIPAVAKAGIIAQPDGEAYELMDVEAFGSDLFTQTTLSPYVDGYVVPLKNGYILVIL